MKSSGINLNLTKDAKVFYIENYKIPLKKNIHEDQRNGNISNMVMNFKCCIIKMTL